MVARRIRFEGRVQGVGFRARTQRVAREFPVVGDVRNLPDGAVELHVEGEADDVDAFLASHREALGHLVRSETSTTVEPRGGTTFEVTW